MSGRRANRGASSVTRRMGVSGVVLEKAEQAHIVELTRRIGGVAMVIGTVRRGSACQACGAWVSGHRGTQQTEGLADLELFLPERDGQREFLKWETKTAVGKLSAQQMVYRDLCAIAGVLWGAGTFAEFERFLAARGYVKTHWIPHYRQQGEFA